MYLRARHRQTSPLRHVMKMNSSHACRKKICSTRFSSLILDAPNVSDQRPRRSGSKPTSKRSAASDGWARTFAVAERTWSPPLLQRKLWNRARASWPSGEFRLRVPIRLCHVNGIGTRTKAKLHCVVARKKTRLECADLFLNQMAAVVAKPDLRGRGGCDDRQVVVHRFAFRFGHWRLSLFVFTPNARLSGGRSPPASARCWAASLATARSEGQHSPDRVSRPP